MAEKLEEQVVVSEELQSYISASRHRLSNLKDLIETQKNNRLISEEAHASFLSILTKLSTAVDDCEKRQDFETAKKYTRIIEVFSESIEIIFREADSGSANPGGRQLFIKLSAIDGLARNLEIVEDYIQSTKNNIEKSSDPKAKKVLEERLMRLEALKTSLVKGIEEITSSWNKEFVDYSYFSLRRAERDVGVSIEIQNKPIIPNYLLETATNNIYKFIESFTKREDAAFLIYNSLISQYPDILSLEWVESYEAKTIRLDIGR